MARLHFLRVALIFGSSQVNLEPRVVNQVVIKLDNTTSKKKIKYNYKVVKLIFL